MTHGSKHGSKPRTAAAQLWTCLFKGYTEQQRKQQVQLLLWRKEEMQERAETDTWEHNHHVASPCTARPSLCASISQRRWTEEKWGRGAKLKQKEERAGCLEVWTTWPTCLYSHEITYDGMTALFMFWPWRGAPIKALTLCGISRSAGKHRLPVLVVRISTVTQPTCGCFNPQSFSLPPTQAASSSSSCSLFLHKRWKQPDSRDSTTEMFSLKIS